MQRGNGPRDCVAGELACLETLLSTVSAMLHGVNPCSHTLAGHDRGRCPRSSDTATGVLEHAAEGLLHSSGATSAATTDDEPEFEDEDDQEEEAAEEDACSADVSSSVEPSASCSVTSEDEPLLDNSEYRKIRDLNRRVLGPRSEPLECEAWDYKLAKLPARTHRPAALVPESWHRGWLQLASAGHHSHADVFSSL